MNIKDAELYRSFCALHKEHAFAKFCYDISSFTREISLKIFKKLMRMRIMRFIYLKK